MMQNERRVSKYSKQDVTVAVHLFDALLGARDSEQPDLIVACVNTKQ